MNLTLIIIILVVLMAAIGGLVVFLTVGSPFGGEKLTTQSAVSSNLRSLVQSQRAQKSRTDESTEQIERHNLALAAAAESGLSRKRTSGSSRMTLEKRLRFGHWPITPWQFRLIQFLAFIVIFVPVSRHGTISTILLTFLAPVVVSGFLEMSIKRHFKAFDDDYPVILLSYVSLLKTGMNTINGLEAAAKGLDPDSVVRAEVELLVERLRLGLTEEQAINSFGEDIAHPELELFVQSLLLSRRVGGTLSATLERLAKQVRKRQQFRQQAVAAVGMERSSIYMIAVIMSLLLGYLAFASPELIFPAFSHPLGNKIFQTGISLIILGFYWSSKVTNIKI